MKIYWLICIALLPQILVSCDSKKATDDQPRTIGLSIIYDNDLAISDWLESSLESFKTKIAPSLKGSNLEINLLKQSTLESIDDISSGKIKPDAILLPHPAFKETIKTQLINLGAPVSNCQDIIGSPFVAVIPRRQISKLSLLLGREIKDDNQNEISIKLEELGKLLKSAQYGYTNPSRSARGLFGLLLSIASIGEANFNSEQVWNPKQESYEAIKQHLEWLSPSDSQLLKKVASRNSATNNSSDSDLEIALVSQRQLKSNSSSQEDFTILLPSDQTIWEYESLCISEADWVSPQKKSVLMQYQQFLNSSEMLTNAEDKGFVALNKNKNPQSEAKVLPAAVAFSSTKTELTKNYANRHKKPYFISLAIDTSSTMNAYTLGQIREFAQKLITDSPPDSKVDILHFSSEVESIGNRETEAQLLESKFSALTPSGGSAIYDAIAKQYEILSNAPLSQTRRIAILITDGNDKNSQISLEDLTNRLSNTKLNNGFIAMDLILLTSDQVDLNSVQKIAEAANGSLYQIEPNSLADLLTEIKNTL